VGLRNARAKGKRLGRPPIFVSLSRLDTLRASGASWRISKELGGWERPTESPSSLPKTPAGLVTQGASRARSESSSIMSELLFIAEYLFFITARSEARRTIEAERMRSPNAWRAKLSPVAVNQHIG
jgi:hypothetical protein